MNLVAEDLLPCFANLSELSLLNIHKMIVVINYDNFVIGENKNGWNFKKL